MLPFLVFEISGDNKVLSICLPPDYSNIDMNTLIILKILLSVIDLY